MRKQRLNKKSYAAFLIDRPFNASQLQQNNEEAIITFFNCFLRHRLRLTVKSKKPAELQAQNIVSNADVGISRKLMLAKYRSFDSTIFPPVAGAKDCYPFVGARLQKNCRKTVVCL
jgi:hypothetical protein